MSLADDLRRRWGSATPRERLGMAAAAAVTAAAALYALAWRPLVQDLEQTEARLAQLRAQVPALRAWSAEIDALRAAALPPPAAGAPDAALLRNLAARHGLAVVRIDAGGPGVVQARIEGPFPAWARWADELHRTRGQYIVSADIAPLEARRGVRVDVTLARAVPAAR